MATRQQSTCEMFDNTHDPGSRFFFLATPTSMGECISLQPYLFYWKLQILMPKLNILTFFIAFLDSNKINETRYYLNQACHLQHQLQNWLRNNFLTCDTLVPIVQISLQQQIKHTSLNMVNIPHLTAKSTP